MELPAKVLIHNQQMGLKGAKGTLLMVDELGYYEVKCAFGGKTHRVLFPIPDTVLIFREPEETYAPDFEIER